MKTKIVTSFNSRIFNTYGKKTLDTWVEHLKLDEGSIVELWINGAFPQGLPQKTNSGTPIIYKSLDVQSEAWKFFFENYRGRPVPQVPQGQEFRYNYIPFSCKVFALAEAVSLIKADLETPRTPEYDTLCWIDADVTMKQDVTSEYLSEVLGGAHLAWLDRGESWGFGETGFIIARTSGETLDIFLHQANLWGSGQLFFFKEWHDAFTFSSCIRYKQFTDGENFIVNNLNKDMDSASELGLYPFKTSLLNTHMEHAKGNLKEKIT